MQHPTPSEGELVICKVKNLKHNGAYVEFDEFPDLEGFIFIGEVAAGWVKNIRGHIREGQRLVCKVLRTRRDGRSLELSLKAVSEERRRERLQIWKNEQRAHQLLGVLAARSDWSEDEAKSTREALIAAFDGLYASLEAAAVDPDALIEAGFEGDWISMFNSIAVENIIPPYVELRGHLTIESTGQGGVGVIREALLAAEAESDENAEITVRCYYDGAPVYRIDIQAPDFQLGESVWQRAIERARAVVVDASGTFTAERG